MIVVLHEFRHADHAAQIASALATEFPSMPVQSLVADGLRQWPAPPCWSDVLVAPFDEQPLAVETIRFLTVQLARQPKPFILPLAVSSRRGPPEPISHIKALPYDNHHALARTCNRIGAMLGLRLRSRDHKVFISYRAADGTGIATQLETFLSSEGYRIWRDESKDAFDGQTMIPPGEDVQQQIEKNLATADLVLLLDTPQAAESYWIDLEINRANGNLVPVLPVLFRRPGERILCSRFRALESLQRGCVIELAGAAAPATITHTELSLILEEMETYLKEIFQRRLRVPFHVSAHFQRCEYDWQERDRFIFESVRRAGAKIRQRVFSHCSVFDGIYDPALRAFVKHLQTVDPRANYALYIYDGQLIPSVQLRQIERAAELADASDVILLHHEEVRALLESNFTKIP